MTQQSAVEPVADRPGVPTAQRRRAQGLVEWAIVVVVALAAVFLIKTYLVQAYYIPSGSMEPTIHIGDRVLVNKLAYDFSSVHTGDIIVFAKPPNDYSPGVKDLIKRVIGLPGQVISSGPHGEIFIDHKLLDQPWLSPGAMASPGPPIKAMRIPAGEYFVMGDNRGDSEDSRYFGPIPAKLIVGKAFVRIWPLSRLHWFAH